MRTDIYNQCKTIIHSSAALAAAGNVVPIPGVGAAADMVSMTSMAVRLANVFGTSISESVAKSMAIAAIKRAALKQPIKMLAKEASKLIPILGQLVAPTLSAGILEAAGWDLAYDMEREANNR